MKKYEFQNDQIWLIFNPSGNIDEIKAESSTVQNIVDTIIQDSMAFVMYVMAILIVAVFVMTLRVTDKKIKK